MLASIHNSIVLCTSLFIICMRKCMCMETICELQLLVVELYTREHYFQVKNTIICFRFGNKEDATQAIVSVHGSEINGHTVKCSWGKESSDPSGPPSQAQPAGAPQPAQQVMSTSYFTHTHNNNRFQMQSQKLQLEIRIIILQ